MVLPEVRWGQLDLLVQDHRLDLLLQFLRVFPLDPVHLLDLLVPFLLDSLQA